MRFDHEQPLPDNLKTVSVESFLHFWSHYNTRIIEILVGLILLCLVYLAYRTFIAPVREEENSTGAGREELEKTLNKILETQKVGAGPQLSDSEAAAEVERLRAEVIEKDRIIAELKARPDAAAVSAEAQATASAAAALGAEEKAKLESTIKDLEARLAEYEIISEDIADLSFYKEENARLQKELEAKGGAAAVAATPEPAPAPQAAPAEEMPPERTVAVPEPEAAPVDPLLAEMAAAAENPAVSKPESASDDSQLMNQFENFVKKG